jgi:hypothetical protein
VSGRVDQPTNSELLDLLANAHVIFEGQRPHPIPAPPGVWLVQCPHCLTYLVDDRDDDEGEGPPALPVHECIIGKLR